MEDVELRSVVALTADLPDTGLVRRTILHEAD
jgi:hypothetical protein